MRVLEIYRAGRFAGTLIEKSRNHYSFRYDDIYFANQDQLSISLTLSKSQKEYDSNYLFPVFYNMLSEGVNRRLQTTQLHLDENDDFGLLMATAQFDTIGAITVKPILSV